MRRHVDGRTERTGIKKKIGERRIRRVAGEEQRHPAEGDAKHEAHVFPRALRRRERRDLEAADQQPLPRGDRLPRDTCARGALGPEPAQRDVLDAAGLDRETDLVAVEHREQAGAVVLMRVSEHDEVDAPLPWRQAGAEQRKEPPGVRAAVDEDDRTAELEEECVALADVERTHASGRSGGRERRGCGGDEHRERERGHARERARSRRREAAKRRERDAVARRVQRERGEDERERRQTSARYVHAGSGHGGGELDQPSHRRRDGVAREREGPRSVGESVPSAAVAMPRPRSGGKSGTAARFASGETSEMRPKTAATIGIVGRLAASVVAMPSRATDGRRWSLAARGAWNASSPAVALTLSWKPIAVAMPGSSATSTQTDRQSAFAPADVRPSASPSDATSAMTPARSTLGDGPTSSA